MNNKINEDLKAAMKDKDAFKLSVLRMLKSALQLEGIEKKHELSDDEVMTVIKRQVKLRKDSIVEYEKYGKLDNVNSLKEEIAILSNYLPEELSEEEISKIVLDCITESNATSIKDMGTVMRLINEKLACKNADMSIVSTIVRNNLNK